MSQKSYEQAERTNDLCRAFLQMRILYVVIGICAAVIFGGRVYAAQTDGGVSQAETIDSSGQETETVSHYAENVTSYAMLPIYARDIMDGTYAVTARSDSRFFTMHDMVLTVEKGEMNISFYIDSTSYGALYMGTADEAAQADENDRILPRVQDGRSYFTIPVEALNSAAACAAFSKSKEIWYDRDILFEASSLPAEALSVELPDYEKIEQAMAAYEDAQNPSAADADAGESETNRTKVIVMGQRDTDADAEAESTGTQARGAESAESGSNEAVGENAAKAEQMEAVSIDLPDGSYSIETVLTGGSGRASVSSPTYLSVQEGKAYATLLWSSTHYDYMIVDGIRYENEAVDGGISRFTIPILSMDTPMDVIADTTAMGEPIEIAYTLTFYSDSIGDTGLIPQEAAKRVLLSAAVIIVLGGILNMLIKRRRKTRT